ncbi:MAG: hypothetical protein ACSHW7_13465 [Patiriisocius sp.]|uniref:hypothetical protein n=1 Tax=Patiriisocius sp. TaxID=2822396 RepID=UPI003EF66DA1
MKKLFVTFAALALIVSVSSCRETTKESAQETLGKAAEDTENNLEEAGDAIENAAEKTGDAIENAAQDVEDEIEGNDDN